MVCPYSRYPVSSLKCVHACSWCACNSSLCLFIMYLQQEALAGWPDSHGEREREREIVDSYLGIAVPGTGRKPESLLTYPRHPKLVLVVFFLTCHLFNLGSQTNYMEMSQISLQLLGILLVGLPAPISRNIITQQAIFCNVWHARVCFFAKQCRWHHRNLNKSALQKIHISHNRR